ncbi:LOW QUALITY PROTEIN: hypothetical protein V2J09_021663, partial [Rumex salicifolius]
WQRRVKDLLTQQGTLKALLEEKPYSIKKEDWDEMQEKTASIIRLCLGEEIWDKLEKMYMSKSLSCKLYGLKMSESSDLVHHVNTFNQIIGDLGCVGVKVDDEDQAMILLYLLIPAYETLLTALTCGKETISLETVSSALLSHNEQQQYTSGDKSQGDGGRQNEKQTNDNITSNDNIPVVISLASCGKTGHFKRDCTNRKLNSAKNSKGSSKSANVVQNDSSEVGIQICSHHTDSWILDSSCSFHMTPHKKWFETYKAGNLGFVRLGDDKTCGIIKVPMHDGIIRTLTEVCHIPALKKNMIFLGYM